MFKFTIPVRAITVLLLLNLVIVPTSVVAQCVAPPSGMINWWTGDDNTFDIIGGNHGTLQNGAGFGAGQVPLALNSAFNFDGVDDYVEVPHDDDAAFNFDGSFTIDAWIFLKSTPAPAEFAPIVSKWDDVPEGVDHQRNYFISATNNIGGLRLRCDVSQTGTFQAGVNTSRVFSTGIIPLNTWTHVACVFNASGPSITQYINGQPDVPIFSQISPTVTDPFDNDRPVLIGAGDLGGNERMFFDGRIDEVELFERALTGTEIDSIFDAGANGKIIPILIDIKPDGLPNSINLKSKGKVPVAVLSTETFDATTMNIGSIRFAGAPVNVKNNGTFHASFEDVNADGLLDLMLHFNTQGLNLTTASTVAGLTGTTNTGRCVSATDSVNIVH